MNELELNSQIATAAQDRLDRRNFFRKAGYFGLGAAVTGLALSGKNASAQQNTYQTKDTVAQMFTAFLIAEDLATTFYYNALISKGVIQDAMLAGPGGSATHVSSTGNVGNVDYLRAALGQEINHANLFRVFLTGSPNNSAADPYQTFYFPAGTFDNLTNFLGILDALENAFIGAYLNLLQELSYKATQAALGKLTGGDAKYSTVRLIKYAKIAGSILGIESEHRVLGRVIGNQNPANNLNAEQQDGITSIFNGPNSAVVALTPFITPATGPGYSLQTALFNHRNVDLPSMGGEPTT